MYAFKSWVVANVELILIGLTILMLLVTGLILVPKGGDQLYVFIILAIVSTVFCAVIVFVIRNGIMALLTIAILVGSGVLSVINEKQELEGGEASEVVLQAESQAESGNDDDEFNLWLSKFFNWTSLICISVVSLLFGILVAIYANRNFDDVVSSRFFYRNSELSVFEEQWKYTFNRLYAGFLTMFGLGMEILCLIVILSIQ